MEAESAHDVDGDRAVWFTQLEARHPLLLALPLPPGAPALLLMLQAHVRDVMDAEAPTEERLEALMRLHRLVAERSPSIPGGFDLVAEVIVLAGMDGSSVRATELLIACHLRRDGIEIVDPGPPRTPATPVHLSRGVEELAACEMGALARKMLVTAVQRLQELPSQQLTQLGDEEAKAAIRLLWLRVQYGEAIKVDGGPSRAGRDYLTGVGLELWKGLLEVISAAAKAERGFAEQYGRTAFRCVRQRLIALGRPWSGPTGNTDPVVPPGHHLVLLEDPPEARESDDELMLKRFRALRQPMRRARLPSAEALLESEARLRGEFPWAIGPIAVVFDELRTQRLYGSVDLRMSPVLLVGGPGLGKSRLARRIAQELLIALLPLALGGMSDARAILGTARGWSTGQPAPFFEALVAHRCASLVLLLDEIDKAGRTRTNDVDPLSALLGLLEPETASHWYDTFLQARCDLTTLLFIATANDTTWLPRALLSRFRVLHFARPTRAQMVQAIEPVVSDVAASWGLPRQALPQIGERDLPARLNDMRDVRRAVLHALSRHAHRHLAHRQPN